MADWWDAYPTHQTDATSTAPTDPSSTSSSGSWWESYPAAPGNTSRPVMPANASSEMRALLAPPTDTLTPAQEPSFLSNVGTTAARMLANASPMTIAHNLSDLYMGMSGDKSGIAPTIQKYTPSSDEATNLIFRDINDATGSKFKPYQPQTTEGKIFQDVVSGVPLVAAGPGGWPGLAARETGNALATTGSDLYAAARPDDPTGAMMVGMAAGLPAMRLQGPMATGLVSGKYGTPTAAQNLQQDFERLDIPTNIASTGQNRVVGLLANVGSWLPGFSGPIRSSIEKGLEGTSNAVNRMADSLLPGAATRTVDALVPEAGSAVQSGVQNYAKGTFKQNSEQLFDNFFNRMNSTDQVPLTSTLDTLGSPVARFPSNPDLGRVITNPKLQQYFDVLAPKTTEIPATFSSILDESGNPILTQAAQKLQSGGTLTFPELKELRSKIGRDLTDPMLVNDIPRSDLNRVYGGISQDLENAAAQQGPEALSAFKMANLHYQAGKNLIDQLEPLLNGSPESTFSKINNAAGTGASANAGMLHDLKRTLPADQWNSVGATVVKSLGTPTAGAKDVLSSSPNFSVSSFSTNWNKLSDSAKDALFGTVNDASAPRANLEALARAAQAQKNVGKLANTSHSGEHLGLAGLAGMAGEKVLEGGWKAAIPYVAGILGANLFSRGMMSPTFSRWLYKSPTVSQTPGQVGQQAIQQLYSLARLNPALQPMADRLNGSQQK